MARMGVMTAVAGCALALAACDDGGLGSRELRETLSGNSAQGLTGLNESYTVYFEPSGTQHMLVDDTGFSDQGQWWVTAEAQYCRRWAQVDGAQQQCFHVTRDGDELTFTQGEVQRVVTLLAGNPANLPQRAP